MYFCAKCACVCVLVTALEGCYCDKWGWMLLISMEWLSIDLSSINLFHLGEFPGVLLWSLALSSVAVGGPLVALVIYRAIKRFVMINHLHQNNLSFTVGVVDFFTRSHKAPALLFQLRLYH